MGRGRNRANKWRSQIGVPLVLAGGWRESEDRDPGHRPAPCWALPGHGVNTERFFGTLAPSYKDYLFKEGNKTGRHAKLRSMQQLSPVWKGYCWKLKSGFFFRHSWAALWDPCLDGGKRQRQMGAKALGAGYADRGWRFVRLLHPTVDIIAVLLLKKNNDPFLCGTSVKWLSEAEGSPVLLSCYRLSLGPSHRLS